MGGQVGIAKLDDGQTDLKVDRSVEMDGKGNGTNPERSFGAGYPVSSIVRQPMAVIDKLCQYSAAFGVPNSNTQERLPVDILHCVDRVGDQIDDDLLNLISIHENLKDWFLDFVLDRRRISG
jgi:hypothetical protein